MFFLKKATIQFLNKKSIIGRYMNLNLILFISREQNWRAFNDGPFKNIGVNRGPCTHMIFIWIYNQHTRVSRNEIFFCCSQIQKDTWGPQIWWIRSDQTWKYAQPNQKEGYTHKKVILGGFFCSTWVRISLLLSSWLLIAWSFIIGNAALSTLS